MPHRQRRRCQPDTRSNPPSTAGGARTSQSGRRRLEVCSADDIPQEDVIRFDHAGQTFAVYRSPDDEYYATDGLCTHEKIHLEWVKKR
jgi:hypothetical protein